MTDPQPTVADDVDGHRFLYVEDGVEAQLVYRIRGNELILVHTEVPDPLGGRGIGGQLVRAAVERAASTGETVLPWCPYARRWLQRHPDEAATIAIDWNDPPT